MLAAQAEKEAERARLEATERAEREQRSQEEAEIQDAAMRRVDQADQAVREYQLQASRTIGRALESFSQHAHRALIDRAERHVATVRFDLQEEIKGAEYSAIDAVLSTVRVGEIGGGLGIDSGAEGEGSHENTMAKIEQAKAKVCLRSSSCSSCVCVHVASVMLARHTRAPPLLPPPAPPSSSPLLPLVPTTHC